MAAPAQIVALAHADMTGHAVNRILAGRPVRLGFAAACACIGGYSIARQRGDVGPALAGVGVLAAAGALLSVLLAMLTAAKVWRLMLGALGSPLPGSWVCYGLQVWLLAVRLGARRGDTLLAIGAFSFAWSVGFIAVFVPAWAGVREVLLVALRGPAVGVGVATAVALMSRVLTTVGDLLTAGAASGYSWWWRSHGSRGGHEIA